MTPQQSLAAYYRESVTLPVDALRLRRGLLRFARHAQGKWVIDDVWRNDESLIIIEKKKVYTATPVEKGYLWVLQLGTDGIRWDRKGRIAQADAARLPWSRS